MLPCVASRVDESALRDSGARIQEAGVRRSAFNFCLYLAPSRHWTWHVLLLVRGLKLVLEASFMHRTDLSRDVKIEIVPNSSVDNGPLATIRGPFRPPAVCSHSSLLRVLKSDDSFYPATLSANLDDGGASLLLEPARFPLSGLWCWKHLVGIVVQ